MTTTPYHLPGKVSWMQRISGSDLVERSYNQESDLLIDNSHKGKLVKVEHRPLAQQAWAEFRAFVFGSWLNLLLLFLPPALFANAHAWGDAYLFVFSMLALTPLAERLGFVTEQLAMYTNDTLGGLINATFGNATELIISGFALNQGLLRVVQLSLLGSIMSNLLLVMGSAFIVGGINHSTQSFNQQGVSVNCGLLMLAVTAVLLPSLLSETETLASGSSGELLLSRFESVLLLGCYALFLVFQLCTHRHLFEDGESDSDAKKSDVESVRGSSQGNKHDRDGVSLAGNLGSMKRGNTSFNSVGTGSSQDGVITSSSIDVPTIIRRGSWRSNPSVEADESGGSLQMVKLSRSTTPHRANYMAEIQENKLSKNPSGASSVGLPYALSSGQHSPPAAPSSSDEKELTMIGCFLWLTGTTLLISLLSSYIVDAIKGASTEMKVPLPFLVTVVLPIVGNAAEHACRCIFAWRKRMEIALGVAVGSATQISVLVIPFCVTLGWIMKQPLDLNFNAFESAVLFISVLMTLVVLQDGRSNWIKGVLLLLTYFMVGAGFWFHKDSDLSITDIDAA